MRNFPRVFPPQVQGQKADWLSTEHRMVDGCRLPHDDIGDKLKVHGKLEDQLGALQLALLGNNLRIHWMDHFCD